MIPTVPELPEVESVVRSLAPRLVGRRFDDLTLGPHDITTPSGTPLRSLLAGRRIDQLTRRAKRILFRLDNETAFFIHLGMTGRLTLEHPDAPLKPHTHLTARFSVDATHHNDLLELRFVDPRRFGEIRWLDRQIDDPTLGPEPLEGDLASLVDHLHARLKSSTRCIKSALLDQSLIAGVGNIYADESLFSAGIHPLRPCKSISHDELTRLISELRLILDRAIASGGSSLRDYVDADGNPGAYQHLHRVYARESEPCPRCQYPIARIVISTRSSHFCPVCQSAPRRRSNSKVLSTQKKPSCRIARTRESEASSD
jgi:formamidopyrimidine-DNA glycosylase